MLLRKGWEVFSNEKRFDFRTARKVGIEQVKTRKRGHGDTARVETTSHAKRPRLEELSMLRACLVVCGWSECGTLWGSMGFFKHSKDTDVSKRPQVTIW